jgi:hypothetical protein
MSGVFSPSNDVWNIPNMRKHFCPKKHLGVSVWPIKSVDKN